MKKVFLSIVAIGILTISNAQTKGNLTDDQVAAVQRLIQLYGYRCDTVNFAMRSNWDGNIEVSCNDNTYSYDVEDKGGRWVVTLD